MKTFNKYLIIIITILTLFGCQKQSRKVQNIETFAELYGYVRWFHPSDEAQEIDWNKFAILGIRKIENVKSEKELRDTLFNLFSPIVQGLQISKEKEKTMEFKSLIPFDTLGSKIVAWQHSGVYLGEKSNHYKSIRVNKALKGSYSIFAKNLIDVSGLRGKEVKLTGYFNLQFLDLESEALMFLCPLSKNEIIQNYSSFISKNNVEISSKDWKKYELITKIGNDVDYIIYGGALKNNISILADDFSFSVKNGKNWLTIDSLNMDFELGLIENNINDWQLVDNGHQIKLTKNEIHSGRFALKAEYTGRLFKEFPKFGEETKEPIGNNLYCVVPLTLYDINHETYPKTDIKLFNKLKREISDIKISSNFDTQTNLACIVISWNVFQHFYPYFDVVKTDWEKVLPETIKKTYADNNNKDFTKTLSEMVAKLNDGHGVVYGERMFHLPIRTELIENEIVITASKDSKLKTGDIIKKVNGVNAKKVLEDLKKTISGSSQLKKYRALNIYGSKYESELTKINVERDGKSILREIQNKKGIKSIFYNPINNLACKYETIKEIEPGIFYLNLSKCTINDFINNIEHLANAQSVIYDYRWGGKLSLLEIIPYLTKTPVNSAWWNVPQVIYSNRKEMKFHKSNWSLRPKEPYLKSKNIIITAPNVVSSGETEIGIIKHYNLGVTVGKTTAGCNGNINFINLPNGFQIMWTGMKVLKHDGTQHHLIGFQPDYPVKRTLLGVKKGRDEVLEQAIKIARN